MISAVASSKAPEALDAVGSTHEQAGGARTTCGAFAASPISLKRRVNTQFLLTTTSCGWLTFLIVNQTVERALPWVILLSTVLLYSLPRWLSLRKELEYTFLPAAVSWEFDLEELTAITAAVSSAVLVMAAFVWHIDLNGIKKPVTNRQIVDIELVSPADAVDKNDVLPSTAKEMVQKKIKGAPYKIVSDRLSGSISRLTAPVSPKGKNEEIEAARQKVPEKRTAAKELQTLAPGKIEMAEVINAPQVSPETATESAQGSTFVAPSRWKTIVVSKSKKGTELANYKAAEPADMIESIDNDGDALISSQSGGRSSGGSGAASNLHEYLKQVNKRVKRNWIPPRGIDRIAVIEFRINESGALTRTRTLSHSGPRDIEAEAAAINAIAKAFPGPALPAEVKARFLDIRYTFNYRFNQVDDMGEEGF